MFNFIVIILSTFFYIGYLPLIPGTFGSLAGLVVFYLIKNNPAIFILMTIIITIVGFLVSGRCERLMKKKDPSFIVIDEVSGMLLSLLFLPYDIRLVIAGFFLFRAFDTVKPFPAGRLQKLPGSSGIMIDDIAAAIYTNILLQILRIILKI